MTQQRVPLPRPRWLTQSGPDNDVALSTRCRIARNIDARPFPWRAGEGARKQVAEAVLDAARRGGGALGNGRILLGEELSSEETAHLLEWRYVSLDWARPGAYRRVVVGADRLTSAMVNEEDHVRVQAIVPGLQVAASREAAEAAEAALGGSLGFARDERIGFLTASLGNAGSGMRVGVLLHLAALAESAELDAAVEAAAELGCAVRGLYGEGTRALGGFYQVSNASTYGPVAADAPARVAAAARYLVELEREARRTRYGSADGRLDLLGATSSQLRRLAAGELPPARLLVLVSVLRLAAAEGVFGVGLAETGEWVAMAGVAATQQVSPAVAVERYEAVWRSAALRQQLRRAARAAGTFTAEFAE
ncbi:MAG: hypothetical protein IT208_13355 [Chthonomonadales bacterium]|nr:hypothetical protein [Chthonomonadales bacterium]